MKQWSLKIKLLIVIATILILTQITSTSLSTFSMLNTSQETEQLVKNVEEQNAITHINQKSDAGAQRVATYLNQAFVIPLSLAESLKNSSTHENGSPFTREQVKFLNRDMLKSNPNVNAVYSQFEPNGYDNSDNKYIGDDSHSSSIGTLEVYWVVEDGEIVFYSTEDPEEKYLAEKDEFGQREAEWYLCSRDTGAPCVIEPYWYEISEGNEVLMTTLAAPIMAGGKFRGLAGVDINLPELQQVVMDISQTLEGSEVILLSAQNRLVATTHHHDYLNRPLSEADTQFSEMLQNGSNAEYFISTASVSLPAANTEWTIAIRQPRHIAMAHYTKLENQLEQSGERNLSSLIVTSIVALVIAIFVISFLVNSFIRPMTQMESKFNSLASAEGDLTQSLRVEQHRELISMALGFNAFTNKLKQMFVVIKQQSIQLDKESNELTKTATSTRSATDTQKRDIDSVAAAVEEMSATSSEVAGLASSVSSDAEEAFEFLQTTQKTVDNSSVEIRNLAEEMQLTSSQILRVSEQSDNINGILETIRGIAEQTNLLALNAAIEAARAGEQGRGFAVVADEVRNLAARTQESTIEIDSLIQSLQSDVSSTVKQIELSQDRVGKSVEESKNSIKQLEQATQRINTINSNVTQVATAANEQSAVSAEISSKLNGIGHSADSLLSLAGEVDQVSEELQSVISGLNQQLDTLKV